MENPSQTENRNPEDQKILSHKKQRFTLSSLEILFGSLIVLGLIYIGYIIFFQESSGPSSKLEKKIISLETSYKEQIEKIDQKIKAIQDSQTRSESRLKALEAANQNLSAKSGKIEPRKAEEKKPPTAAPEKRKIQNLEATNQNLPAKVEKIEPPKAEEKKPTPAAPEKRKIQHKVKKGETLGSIAVKYKVSKKDLIQWNKWSKNKPVRAGDTLIILSR
jgi:LysM repeat protein